MVLVFAKLVMYTQRPKRVLPFWKWAELKGWLMTWFPGWRGVVWGDAAGYWCRSLFGSRCLIEQTWWLRSSRWHGKLPRTTLAFPPTAAKHQHCRFNFTGFNLINFSTPWGNTWSEFWLTCKLLWRSKICQWINRKIENVSKCFCTSSQTTTVGPSHWAKGSPCLRASSSNSCLETQTLSHGHKTRACTQPPTHWQPKSTSELKPSHRTPFHTCWCSRYSPKR